jgi:hypothetical protein
LNDWVPSAAGGEEILNILQGVQHFKRLWMKPDDLVIKLNLHSTAAGHDFKDGKELLFLLS